MNQKAIKLSLLALLLSLSLGFSFFNFSVSKAQTTDAKTTPTVSPSPSPTILDDDDGPIIIDEELVNLNVRVVDRNNRPIPKLKESDFQIFEDKILQPSYSSLKKKFQQIMHL